MTFANQVVHRGYTIRLSPDWKTPLPNGIRGHEIQETAPILLQGYNLRGIGSVRQQNEIKIQTIIVHAIPCVLAWPCRIWNSFDSMNALFCEFRVHGHDKNRRRSLAPSHKWTEPHTNSSKIGSHACTCREWRRINEFWSSTHEQDCKLQTWRTKVQHHLHFMTTPIEPHPFCKVLDIVHLHNFESYIPCLDDIQTQIHYLIL